MSWPAEEWKVGLPVQALRAIAEVEQRLERLQKERQQKQVQLDTLEAIMHKQRKKHEEERVSWSLISQQNRSLAEAREQTERARQRLAQELQAKEAQQGCLEAQLAQATRRQADLEEELRRCQLELERLHSRSKLVLPSSSWSSPTPRAEGGGEVKAEPSRTLAAGTSQIQRNGSLLASSWENETPVTHWRQETTCPGAPPGSPVPTENGEGMRSVASELVSSGEWLKKDNEELRTKLARAEKQNQEKERELWRLRKQVEETRAELAQWKKQRSNQAEQGLLGAERMPPSGSCRSTSSSHLELPAVKRGAAVKQKGACLRPQSPEQAQEELQALRAEVLMLRQHLDASESQCKCLLETRCQNRETQASDQAKQALSWGVSQKKGMPEIQGNSRDGLRVLGPDQGEASIAGKVKGGRGRVEMEAWLKKKGDLELLEVGETGVGMAVVESGQASGKLPSLAEEEDCTTIHTLPKGEANHEGKTEPEGDMEALHEEIRALATGKAKAEAQASLAQQKLQSLQATLGKQTERLAEAMETQSHHLEELLTSAEEKDQLVQSLNRELEETKKAFGAASAENQQLRALLRKQHGAKPAKVSDTPRGSNTREAPGEELQDQTQEGQEIRDLQEELARQEAWRWGKGDGGTIAAPESVHLGGLGQAETVDVLQAAQKRERWLQGSRRDAETQTEGPYCGLRRREQISVAFDDTQYEPYGLPEVVMKGFADIPQGPLCPYVLRRGILGSAPVAQLAPRAEPEDDSPEGEEGTGV
ncbi:centromere protein F-like [Heteronotia binoei]|uniref:centromere protein F-like n=1 Tax=Heteronotia binoei TaxID=13085 RepID=UPI002931E5B2|nr:centromere protein F-like [Heteronotia binoei]